MDKVQYLNGLRGMAALIVVFNHFVDGFLPALHSGNINETHFGKSLGVCARNSDGISREENNNC